MKRRLLLLSNSTNPGQPPLSHALESIAECLGPGVRRIAFVPFAAVRFSFDEYTAKVRSLLAPLGYETSSIHDAADPVRAIDGADAIAVGGGNTFHLLREVCRRNLLAPIRSRALDGLPYLGWSAGANLACPTIRTTNDMPIVEPPSLEALGLVPFQINPHYTDRHLDGHGGETRDDRLLEFVTANPGVPVVGLREGSMIRLEGKKIRLLGGKPARIFGNGGEPREVEGEGALGSLLS